MKFEELCRESNDKEDAPEGISQTAAQSREYLRKMDKTISGIVSLEMLTWLEKNNVDQEFIDNLPPRVSMHFTLSSIGVVNEYTGLVVNRRMFNPKKNIVYKENDTDIFVCSHALKPSHLIITEDPLSAIRAWQAGFQSLALLGCNLTSGVKNYIRSCLDQYAHLIIHTDPDPAGLKAAASLGRDLRSLGTYTYSNYPMSTGKEAKEFLLPDLRALYTIAGAKPYV